MQRLMHGGEGGGEATGRQQSRGSFTETDEEVSRGEDEALRARPRRDSAPVYSPYSGLEFNSRRTSYSNPRIPVGRVTPITPSVADPSASSPVQQKLTLGSRVMSGAASPVAKPLAETEDVPENAAKASSNAKLTAEVISPSIPTVTVPSFSPGDCALKPRTVAIATNGTCLKECERAILSSGKFIDKMKRLAESGSSDQDSDSEPHKVFQRESQIQVDPQATPTRLVLNTICLKKDNACDFGFSLSDGLSDPGVYVRTLRPGGPAEQSGELHPYDRILKVG